MPKIILALKIENQTQLDEAIELELLDESRYILPNGPAIFYDHWSEGSRHYFDLEEYALASLNNSVLLDFKTAKKIINRIESQGYTFSLDEVIEEYIKFRNNDYISHSFKKIILKFRTILDQGYIA